MKKYKGVYKPRKKVKKICNHCENEFLGNSRRVYCSKECADIKKLERLKKKYVPKKIWIMKKILCKCKLCKKEFIQKTPNQIFCNKECSKKYQRDKYHKISLGQLEGLNQKYVSLLKLRFEIFKRDNFLCQYCGRTPKRDKCKLVIDHIIPRNKGGLFIFENLTTSCEECNLGKSDILLEKRQLNKLEIKNE